MATPLLFANLTIPPAASVNAAASGTAARQLAAAGAGQVVPLVYGEDRLGGLILNVLPTTAGGTTVAVQVLWAFASDSINDVRWNDQALPGTVTATHYTGAQVTADATMVAAFAAQGITYADALNGYAYSVFVFAASLFDGQLNFSARIRGRKLYDSRLDSTAGGSGAHRLADPATWAWSDCPALALADYLRNTVYGIGVTVDNSTVAGVANANDALIGSPAEKRRMVGVSFAAPADVASVADALRVYAGCWLLPGANGIKLLADADGASQATYAHDSGQIYSIEPLTLRDLGNTPTVVEVLYTDTSRIPYREGRATAQLSGAGTTLPWRVSQVRLPGIKRHSQAYREAVERLNKLTLMDISTVVEVFDQGIQHDPGDIITITHPIGLAAKLMRVADVAMTALGRWRLSVVEHDAAAYSTAVVTLTTLADGSRIIGADKAVAWASIQDKPPDSELVNLQGPYAVAQAWNFNGSAEGWSANGATLAAGGLALLVTSTGLDPQLVSPSISINGAGFYQVRARIKRAAGSGWEGTLYYSTVGHGYSASYRETVADTTVTGQWVVVEWDMLSLTVGGSDWIDSTITGIRLDLGSSAADVFDIDWIGVGTTGPGSYGAEWGKNVIGSAAVDAAISTAQTTATAANSAAAAAQTSANTANTAIANITSDNVLSKGEKSAVILEWTAIAQEQAGIDAQATAYGITTQKTEYDSAISALATYLGAQSPAWNDVAQDTPITGTTFRSNFAAVYAKRQALLDQIAALARTLANAAQATANTASTNATAAQSLLATMRSNGYIDAAEKPALMREWGYIVGEYSPLSTQATAYGITTEKTAYDNAYSALNSYLGGLTPSWTDTTTDTPVTPAVDQAKWSDYYTARGTLTQRIAEEAGKRALWSSVSGSGKPQDNANNSATGGYVNADPTLIRPAVWQQSAVSGAAAMYYANFNEGEGLLSAWDKPDGGRAYIFSESFAVSPTRTYQIEQWVRRWSGSTAAHYLAVQFLDYAGAVISTPVPGWSSVGTYHYWGLVNQQPAVVGGNYYTLPFGAFGTATIPANAVAAKVGILGSESGAGRWSMGAVRVREITDVTTSAATLWVGRGVTVVGSTATRSAAGSSYDADCYSQQSYTGGAAFSAVPATSAESVYFGLNTDPSYDSSFASLDYALRLDWDGTLSVAVNGTPVAAGWTYSAGMPLSVTYDGSRVRFGRAGVEIYSIAATISAPLYADTSFGAPGSRLLNMQFVPMSAVSNIGTGQIAAGAATGVYTNTISSYTVTQLTGIQGNAPGPYRRRLEQVVAVTFTAAITGSCFIEVYGSLLVTTGSTAGSFEYGIREVGAYSDDARVVAIDQAASIGPKRYSTNLSLRVAITAGVSYTMIFGAAKFDNSMTVVAEGIELAVQEIKR